MLSANETSKALKNLRPGHMDLHRDITNKTTKQEEKPFILCTYECKR